MLEIGIRGINADSKEYFIMVLLEKDFLDESKRKYDIEPIGLKHGGNGWVMRETDERNFLRKDFEETETLELKKSTSELKEAIISIAAILNKHQTIRDVSKTIADHIEPKIYPKIKKTSLDGADCIHIEFQGNNSPYYAYGRAYIRVGDEDSN
jgi:hypothetical protein